MRFAIVRPLLLLCALLFLPALIFAQEAVLIGTTTDATGGVLPGVAVQATHESSGNTIEAVTDGRGMYRIPVKKKTPAWQARRSGRGPAVFSEVATTLDR